MSFVWTQIAEDGLAVRIFKNLKAAVRSGTYPHGCQYVEREIAVDAIRRKIWLRDKKHCTHCGSIVSWFTMQMHERIFRGRGGEVSVENGTTLCADCHHNDDVAGHGKRKPQW